MESPGKKGMASRSFQRREAGRPHAGGRKGAPRIPERPGMPRTSHRAPISIPPVCAPPEAVVQLLWHWGERAAEIQAKLSRYIEILLRANAEFNLTADRQPDEQWRRHIEDALLNARAIEQIAGAPTAGLRIADVGSGGGMPGIVWAILWPQAKVALIETTDKKARFLERAANLQGLTNVTVIAERAELVAHQPGDRERYDWVSARALAALPVLAELTLPLARIGGSVFAIKGSDIADELKAARRAARLLGAPNPPQIHPYTRSDGKTSNLVIYKKTDKSPSPYPRRPGVAQKSPL
jgi:16S rRNA (guanine527-N7)-methyltransferase